jgi:hypothetical protein
VIKRLAQEGLINVCGKSDPIKFKPPDKQGHVISGQSIKSRYCYTARDREEDDDDE